MKKIKKTGVIFLIFFGVVAFQSLPLLASENFTENFSTNNYKDSSATIANWDTSSGEVSLNSSGANFTHIDGTGSGAEVVGNPSFSEGPSLQEKVTTNDKTFLVWLSEDYQVYFKEGTSSGWSGEVNVSNSLQSTFNPSLAVNDQNEPVVAWSEDDGSGMKVIKVAWRSSGLWQTHTISNPYSSMVSDNPKVEIDSSGRPNLMFIDLYNAHYGVYFTRWNGSAWVKADGSSGIDKVFDGATYSPSFTLDSNDNPLISWHYTWFDGGDYSSHAGVYFSRWNGSNWTRADNTTLGSEMIYEVADTSWQYFTPTVLYDSSDNPIVIYQNGNDTFNSLYAANWNGSSWNNNWLGYSTGKAQAFMDADKDIHLVWEGDDGGGGDSVHYSEWSGGSWSADEMIYDPEDCGNFDAVAVTADNDNNPIVAWSESFSNILYFGKWNGSSWDTAMPFGPSGWNFTAEDLVLENDSLNNTHIAFSSSYEDQNIYYAKYSSQYSNQIAQSIKINGTFTGITTATLDAQDATPSGTSIDYSLSNDGGDTWHSVTKNTPFNFPLAGNDLRWKASLNGIYSTPSIDEMQITYDSGSSSSIPTVSTQPATSITLNSATLNANLTDTGGEDPTRYIEYGTSTGTYTQECNQGTGTIGTYSCDLTNFSSNTTYYFRAKATNSAGTSYGMEESFTTLTNSGDSGSDDEEDSDVTDDDCVPTRLKAKAISDSEIKLKWKDDCSVEEGYEIERKDVDGKFKTIAETDKNDRIHTDKNLEAETTYIYRVRAFRKSKESDYSNKEEAITLKKEATSLDDLEIINTTVDDEKKKEDLSGDGEVSNNDNDRQIEEGNDNNFKNNDEKSVEKKQENPSIQSSINSSDSLERGIGNENEENLKKNYPNDFFDSESSSVNSNLENSLKQSFSEQPLLTALAMTVSAAGWILGATSVYAASSPILPASSGSSPFSDMMLRLSGVPFYRSRKDRDWGVVFEGETRTPIKAAVVSIINTAGHVVDSTVTDESGRYGFLVKEGEYILKIDKKNYQPDYSNQEDEFYGDIYAGGKVTVKNGELIKLNIAMFSTEDMNWREYAAKKIKTYFSTLAILKRHFFTFLFYVGMFFSIAATYLSPNIFNFTILGLYFLVIVYWILLRRKSFGVIIDKENNPMPFAMIGLYDLADENRRLAFAVSDVLGRYYLLAEKDGDYFMKIKGQALDGRFFNKMMRVTSKDGIVKIDVSV